MLITIENLDFSYGIQNIFHHLSFTVQEKEKIGLIGDNGCGKTTFLKLINGELFPDSGKIHFRSNLSLGYLAQENNLSDSETLHTAFLNIFKDLLTIEEKMTALQNTINTSEGEKQKKAVLDLGTLQEIYEQNGGYEYPSRIRGIANGLGFTDDDLSKPLSQFSGGQ
ncbi:MAG: ATP-binding cassette domain-containing protein, partial [Eubacteriaceae bacterium]|nr:ATP-binding cassette domain-containing protein [Eubacteriaceae bacterium]